MLVVGSNWARRPGPADPAQTGPAGLARPAQPAWPGLARPAWYRPPVRILIHGVDNPVAPAVATAATAAALVS